MKRAMLLLMALLAFAHAALAEDFSAYAVKTNGFAVFAPNPILENGDMFFETWSDRVGTVGDGYFWHFEWMRGGSVYRDLPYRGRSRSELESPRIYAGWRRMLCDCADCLAGG